MVETGFEPAKLFSHNIFQRMPLCPLWDTLPKCLLAKLITKVCPCTLPTELQLNEGYPQRLESNQRLNGN